MKTWGAMGLYVTDYAETQSSLDPQHCPKDCQVLLESHHEPNLPKDPKLHAHGSNLINHLLLFDRFHRQSTLKTSDSPAFYSQVKKC